MWRTKLSLWRVHSDWLVMKNSSFHKTADGAKGIHKLRRFLELFIIVCTVTLSLPT
jgi:hypothetical protein